jgi:hypothetical protein
MPFDAVFASREISIIFEKSFFLKRKQKKMLIIELVLPINPFANLNNTTIKRVTNPVVILMIKFFDQIIYFLVLQKPTVIIFTINRNTCIK